MAAASTIPHRRRARALSSQACAEAERQKSAKKATAQTNSARYSDSLRAGDCTYSRFGFSAKSMAPNQAAAAEFSGDVVSLSPLRISRNTPMTERTYPASDGIDPPTPVL